LADLPLGAEEWQWAVRGRPIARYKSKVSYLGHGARLGEVQELACCDADEETSYAEPMQVSASIPPDTLWSDKERHQRLSIRRLQSSSIGPSRER
jgi:hypothetical protein